MLYKSVSIDPVIGAIIRNTRVQDSAYIIDMHTWIPEAMDLMHLSHQLSQEYADVPIKFHKGKLPCGLIYLDAVEHQGRRLPVGNSVKNIHVSQANRRPEQNPPVFTSGVTKTAVPDGNYIYQSTLEKVQILPYHIKHYYQLEMDHILTSFENGHVRIFFQQAPHDERGLPLIPDNQNFKQAIYWYVRAMMIGAGFQDNVFKEQVCTDRFDFYMGRAVAEIEYPSPDDMEHRVNTFRRFIPPENYYENYFRVTGPEPYYDPLGPFDSYYI